jgi:hypothetical protein
MKAACLLRTDQSRQQQGPGTSAKTDGMRGIQFRLRVLAPPVGVRRRLYIVLGRFYPAHSGCWVERGRPRFGPPGFHIRPGGPARTGSDCAEGVSGALGRGTAAGARLFGTHGPQYPVVGMAGRPNCPCPADPVLRCGWGEVGRSSGLAAVAGVAWRGSPNRGACRPACARSD